MKEFGVVRVFLAIQRNLKIIIKRVKKLQKLINDVQKKTMQNRKNKKCKKPKSVLHAEKHRMCTQKIRKSRYTQKIKQSYRKR